MLAFSEIEDGGEATLETVTQAAWEFCAKYDYEIPSGLNADNDDGLMIAAIQEISFAVHQRFKITETWQKRPGEEVDDKELDDLEELTTFIKIIEFLKRGLEEGSISQPHDRQEIPNTLQIHLKVKSLNERKYHNAITELHNDCGIVYTPRTETSSIETSYRELIELFDTITLNEEGDKVWRKKGVSLGSIRKVLNTLRAFLQDMDDGFMYTSAKLNGDDIERKVMELRARSRLLHVRKGSFIGAPVVAAVLAILAVTGAFRRDGEPATPIGPDTPGIYSTDWYDGSDSLSYSGIDELIAKLQEAGMSEQEAEIFAKVLTNLYANQKNKESASEPIDPKELGLMFFRLLDPKEYFRLPAQGPLLTPAVEYGHPSEPRERWPHIEEIEVDDDGTVRYEGHKRGKLKSVQIDETLLKEGNPSLTVTFVLEGQYEEEIRVMLSLSKDTGQ